MSAGLYLMHVPAENVIDTLTLLVALARNRRSRPPNTLADFRDRIGMLATIGRSPEPR